MTFSEALDIFSLSTLADQNEEKLRRLYHKLAQKHHPDKGGNHEEFIRLRQAFALLRKQIQNPDISYTRKTPDKNTPYQSGTQSNIHKNRGYYETKKTGFSRSSNDFTNEIYEELQRYKTAFNEAMKTVELYEDIFNYQIRIINQNNSKINSLIEQNNIRRKQDRSMLEEKVRNLQRQAHPSWWRFLLGANNMPQNEYMSRYNRIVEEFNQISSRKESEFINAIIDLYANNSKQIFDSLNKY